MRSQQQAWLGQIRLGRPDQRCREKRAKPADTGARLTMDWICINGIPSIMPLGVVQREGTGEEMSVGELSDFGLGC